MHKIINSFTENSARLRGVAKQALSRHSSEGDIYSYENLAIEMTAISLWILCVNFCQVVVLPYAQNNCAKKEKSNRPLNWCNHHVVEAGVRELKVQSKVAESIMSTLFPDNSPFPKINAIRHFFAHRSLETHARLNKVMEEEFPINCSGADLCGKFVGGVHEIELWIQRSQAIGKILCKELSRHTLPEAKPQCPVAVSPLAL